MIHDTVTLQLTQLEATPLIIPFVAYHYHACKGVKRKERERVCVCVMKKSATTIFMEAQRYQIGRFNKSSFSVPYGGSSGGTHSQSRTC